MSGRASIPAGIIEVHARLRPGPGRVIDRVWIMGDVFVAPPRALPDLEAALAGLPAAEASAAVTTFLTSRGVEILGGTADDIAHLV
ncbi:hypothetical protein ACSTJG_25165, partial [Vibrio parahaemolyticus]